MATKKTRTVPKRPTRAKGASAKSKANSKPARTASKSKAVAKAKPGAASALRAAKSTSKSKSKPKTAPRSKPKAKAASRSRSTASAPMFEKIAFTMFSVTDPHRARDFYENVLGLTRGLASASGTWTEYDLPGGGCLALFCHPNPAFAQAPGGAGVALEVADLDSLNQRLVAAGVTYKGDMIHGPNCRMSNISDSEGNAIILHQLNHKH